MDVFIVNPIANNGDSLRFLNIMQRIYESYNRKYVVVFTEKGKTTEITSFYAHNEKINNIVITHGDFDHMGDEYNLDTNFKVKNVFFNSGT